MHVHVVKAKRKARRIKIKYEQLTEVTAYKFLTKPRLRFENVSMK